MALVFDPASPSFNAYASVAQADAYHATRLHNTTWTGATTGTKESAIIWATRNFEVLDWKGWMTNPAQNLQWPRTGVFRNGGEIFDASEAALYYNILFDGATIPTFLRDATAEAAMWLIASDVTAATGTEGFKAIAVDTVKLEIDKADRPKWIHDSVRNMIWRYIRNSNPYMCPVQRV